MTLAPEHASQTAPTTARRRTRDRFTELFLILLAVAISAGAYVLTGMGAEGEVPANAYSYAAWLAALGLALHAVVWWRASYADPVLVPIAVLLNGVGLAMIYRIDLAKDNTAANSQLIWMTLGTILAGLVLVLLRDHRLLRRYTYTCGLAAIVFLLLPLIPGLGAEINGARIWIRLGGMSFQPGEIAKILLALFFAGYLVSFRDQLVLAGPKILGIRFPRLRDMGPIFIAWVASVGILVFERDLGTSLLFFGMFVAMLYVATAKKTWIFLGLGLFAVGAFIASQIFSHVGQRVDGWLNALTPEEYNRTPGGSYQLVQGLFGMADGGLLGKGLGQGRPQVVPYAESDFIIASLGEELGLIGVFALLMLYVLLFARGMKIAERTRDGFGTLFAAGITFTIGLQCFIVIGGVTRLIPLTGLTTPFMAHGGSSLVANWIIIGLLLRISDSARRPQEEFRTGVLSLVSDDLDREEAPASAGGDHGSAAGVPARPAPVAGDDAPTEARPRIGGTDAVGTGAAGTGTGHADDAPTQVRPALRDMRDDHDDRRNGGTR
ncbi:FtsW/RodA/SpoVE family cell cycle protein [Brevibacterium album]|uniref:FtsW/RodA/SpoVE family cell cycle protein n=1 Tax=Brevibacterium album TaxID=417948 RepID=UPI0003FA1BB2|nr:FtsW/RodA/SpoVE family cell cycle protein [Brevibacterium album]